MSDKPILFSGPMVRALLEGRKTQTRRVLKIRGHDGFFQFGPSDTPGHDWHFRRKDHVWEDYTHEHLLSRLPIQKDDRLWVRETWRPHGANNGLLSEQDTSWCTGPDDAEHYADAPEESTAQFRFFPSIHMPRWASRITLKVTDVRVQRLQEISEADAIAEGCLGYVSDCGDFADTPQDDFRILWNSINGPKAWDANPWVAAYTFEVVKQNIDQMKAAA